MLKKLWSFFKVTCLVILAVLILLFAAANRAPITFSLFPFPFEAQMPLFLLTLLAFCFGALAGGITISFQSMHRRRQVTSLKQRVSALENELAALKQEGTLKSTSVSVMEI